MSAERAGRRLELLGAFLIGIAAGMLLVVASLGIMALGVASPESYCRAVGYEAVGR